MRTIGTLSSIACLALVATAGCAVSDEQAPAPESSEKTGAKASAFISEDDLYPDNKWRYRRAQQLLDDIAYDASELATEGRNFDTLSKEASELVRTKYRTLANFETTPVSIKLGLDGEIVATLVPKVGALAVGYLATRAVSGAIVANMQATGQLGGSIGRAGLSSLTGLPRRYTFAARGAGLAATLVFTIGADAIVGSILGAVRRGKLRDAIHELTGPRIATRQLLLQARAVNQSLLTIINGLRFINGLPGDAKGALDASLDLEDALLKGKLRELRTCTVAAKLQTFDQDRGAWTNEDDYACSETEPIAMFWRGGEPNDASDGESCAIMDGADPDGTQTWKASLWNDVSCKSYHEYACHNAAGEWRITPETGTWFGGFQACQGLGAGYAFAVPKDEVENMKLAAVRTANGRHPWLNFTNLHDQVSWHTEADSPDVRVAPEDRVLAFGGAFGSVANGNVVVNPATGGESCPEGYDARRVLGTQNVDWSLFICVGDPKKVISRYEFGGMYGYVEGRQSNNPYAGAWGCPTGFTSQHVLGTDNTDYDAHICYRERVPGADDYEPPFPFAGVIGHVDNGQLAKVTAASGEGCPFGYSEEAALGTNGVDWGISFCHGKPKHGAKSLPANAKVVFDSIFSVTLVGSGADRPATLGMSTNGPGPEQQFTIVATPDGYHQIRQDGLCLDISGASHDEDALSIMSQCHGGDNQKFTFVPHVDGGVEIRVKHSGMYLVARTAGQGLVRQSTEQGFARRFRVRVADRWWRDD